jgi:hypothetical protein
MKYHEWMNIIKKHMTDNPPFRTREEIMEDLSKDEERAWQKPVSVFANDPPPWMKNKKTGEIRIFATGATRDIEDGKHDPEGFLSPLTILRYCEYMTKHRPQKDGSIRDSDNWQKGFPLDSYMKSMWRHMLDAWLHHRGFGEKSRESLQVALCAIIFNAGGMLHELLKKELSQGIQQKIQSDVEKDRRWQEKR